MIVQNMRIPILSKWTASFSTHNPAWYVYVCKWETSMVSSWERVHPYTNFSASWNIWLQSRVLQHRGEAWRDWSQSHHLLSFSWSFHQNLEMEIQTHIFTLITSDYHPTEIKKMLLCSLLSNRMGVNLALKIKKSPQNVLCMHKPFVTQQSRDFTVNSSHWPHLRTFSYSFLKLLLLLFMSLVCTSTLRQIRLY